MRKQKRIIALTLAVLLLCSSFGIDINSKAAEITNIAESQMENDTRDTLSDVEDDNSSEYGSIDVSNQANEWSEKKDSIKNEDNTVIENQNQEINTSVVSLINYVGIDKPYLVSPDTQNIVVSYGVGSEEITDAKIHYKKADGSIYEMKMSERQSELFLFQQVFNSENKGVYTLESFDYIEDGVEKTINLEDIGIQAMFGVDEKYPGYETMDDSVSAEDIEISVVDARSNEENTIEGNVEEAIANTAEEVTSYSENAISTYSINSDVVVVLDPGHGGSDSGALGYGLQEKNLTLKIANYCKEELEQYSGVKVYMTREDDRYLGDSAGDAASDLANRVNMAEKWGADLLVSIHINAGGGNGVEVYYPNLNFNASIGSQGEEVATQIQKQLVALGLYDRGIKIKSTINDEYDDGSKQDYYGIIRRSKLAGFPGIIVEHAFIDNAQDAKLLKDESFLKKCGVADATGIANYFGLKKESRDPYIKLNGVSTTETRNGMSIYINPMIETNVGDVTYKYQIYDVAQNTWETIGADTSNSKVEWKPKKAGDYWIYVEASSDIVGKQEYTTGYRISPDRAYINSFSADKTQTVTGEDIKFKADYEVLQSEKNKIQFLVYNGNSWIDITGDDKNESVWNTKKSGNYLVCFQITTENGKIFQAFTGIEVIEKKKPVIHSIQVGSMNSKGEIELKANVDSNGWKLKYTFKEYDMTNWSTISSGTDSSAKWKPAKSGSHLLYLEAVDEDNQKYTYSMGCMVDQLVRINKFSADKLSPQSIGNTIVLDASAFLAAGVEASCEYMYYDGKTWHSIQKSNEIKKAEWVPEKGGEYLLAFQIVTKAGEVFQSFMGYTISEPKVSIKGINISELNSKGEVELRADVQSNDDHLKYTFKIYDMHTWSSVAESSKVSVATWKPKVSGNYLVYLEVTTSLGKRYTYCMGYIVEDTVSITGLNKNVMSPQTKGTSIKLKGQISALFQDNLEYQYMVYDGKSWSLVASSTVLDEVEWKPDKVGQYVLCFQVKKKDGQLLQWFESYTISNPFVSINGINLTNINNKKEIKLTPSITTNDNKLSYTYQVYNMSEWKTIAKEVQDSSVVWNVEQEGTYLLHLKVKDSIGNLHTYDMGVQVSNNIQVEGIYADKSSPQTLSTDLRVTLSGKVSADYYKGLRFRYMLYDGDAWYLLSESLDKLDVTEWKPDKAGDYLLCLQVEKENGQQINAFMRYSIKENDATEGYFIMGAGSTSVQQMVKFFNANNPNYDKYAKVSGYDGVLAKGGAATITDYCRIFAEEAAEEGVKTEVAFCQAMLETGFLQFGGDVKPDQYNFAGLGATGGGEQGNRFKTVREGIRAQIQHLKCYASIEPLNNPCVDQRWWEALRGTAPTVEKLSLKWAASAEYGERILELIKQLKQC